MHRNKYKIKLHGSLGKAFVEEYIELYARDLREVVAGLCSRFGDSFKDTILHGAWHITNGKLQSEELTAGDNFISEELIEFPLLEEEIHIFPAIIGAGGKMASFGVIIIGVLLVATGVGALAGVAALSMGTTMAVGLVVGGALMAGIGAMSMLAKTPQMSDYGSAAGASVEQKQSFIYNGAVNNTEQGVPVPLVYGRHFTGSTIISAGLTVEQLI